MQTKLVAACVLAVVCNPIGAQVEDAQPEFSWRTDLAAAERLAAKSGKPLLLAFR